jgi:SAM-dependent methyltransferase
VSFSQNWLEQEWADSEYMQYKQENFLALDSYLNFAPQSILDIGCGLAWESRMFNEKYGTELWLLDGDQADNKDVPAADGGWHPNPENFLYYYPLKTLDSELKKRGTNNYHLVDCNNISIPSDKKFDLITSWLSCGFHYPVSTYQELIKKHSHEKTRLIFDIRINYKTKKPRLDDSFEILAEIQKEKRLLKSWKHITAEIKIK